MALVSLALPIPEKELRLEKLVELGVTTAADAGAKAIDVAAGTFTSAGGQSDVRELIGRRAIMQRSVKLLVNVSRWHTMRRRIESCATAESLMSGARQLCLVFLRPTKPWGKEKNGNCFAYSLSAPSCADLSNFTGSQDRQNLRSNASSYRAIGSKHRRPPLSGQPVALPPLGNRGGWGAGIGRHGFPRGPELDD